MTQPTYYGQAQSEKYAEENAICRKIVHEITSFGISQRQHLLIVHFLALELENVEHMRSLTKLVREIGGNDLFLIGSPQSDNEIEGENDGTPNV